MPTREDEIEAFKTDIDLRVVAAQFGYQVNPKRSSRGSTAMDNASGDRILIALASDGHHIYCSVSDPFDNGSVIDFWQRRRGGSLGDIRKALRGFLGGEGSTAACRAETPPLLSTDARMPGHTNEGPSQSSGGGAFPPLRPIERDLLGVQARYAGYRPLGSHHPYLCGERAIPGEILALPIFADRLRLDGRGNAVFPHFNNSGLCGYEARNHGFMAFSKGGVKGLFCSTPGSDDRVLVIAESALDAISYGAIRGCEHSRFISFSGGLNNEQPTLLRQAMDRMPAGSRIVAGVDHDEAGDRYLDQLHDIFDGLGRGDLEFVVDRPERPGADWNAALQASVHSPSSTFPRSP